MPFRAASTTGNTTGNNISNPTITIPTSGSGGTVVAGDVAWIFVDAADTGTLTPPAGWTLAESQGLTTDTQPTSAVSIRRYWKALVSGDLGATITFTGSGAQRRSLECVVFSGVDNTTPEATETPTSLGYSSSSSTRANPSTTLLGTRDVITAAGNRSGTTTTSWTRPSGWTHATDAFNSGTGGATGSVAYKEAVAAGSIGGDNWTASNSTSGAVTMLIVLKPDSTAKAGSDTGAVADAGTLAATLAGTDTASGANAATLAATGTATDTGTGADVAALATAISAADTATGVDGARLGLSATDTATGVDAATLAATSIASDTGTAVDTVKLGLAGSDTGTGADTAGLAAALSAPDTATAANNATLAAASTAGDTATGADAATLAAQPAATDTGVGADAAALSAAMSATDTGSGVDVGSTPGAATPKSGTDTATGADSATVTSATAGASDTAHAADSASVMVLITATDNATATDLGVLAAGVAAADLATALDLASALHPDLDRDITATATLIRDWRASLADTDWAADLEPRRRHAALETNWAAEVAPRDWKARL